MACSLLIWQGPLRKRITNSARVCVKCGLFLTDLNKLKLNGQLFGSNLTEIYETIVEMKCRSPHDLHNDLIRIRFTFKLTTSCKRRIKILIDLCGWYAWEFIRWIVRLITRSFYLRLYCFVMVSIACDKEETCADDVEYRTCLTTGCPVLLRS